ncbi:MAG: hypothetical protein FWJ83_10295 [Limnochordales bacterium]
MAIPWPAAALAFTLAAAIWPLTVTFEARAGRGGAQLDVSSVGMLWRARLRLLHARATLQEASVEVRFLHFLTLRKEWPAVSVAWRGLVPSWRVVSELEAGLGKAGDGAEADHPVTWARVRRWARAWRRWRPAARAARQGLRFVGRRLVVSSLRIALRVAVDDPAAAAWVHGLAWSVLGAALGRAQGAWRFRRPPRVTVQPVVAAGGFDFRMAGQASVRQIEAAAGLALAAAAYAGEKLAQAARARRPARPRRRRARRTAAACG